MNVSDRIKESTTATSTATVSLLGAVANCAPFLSASIPVGTVDIPVCVSDNAGNWEIADYTLTSASLLTRQSTIWSSSNGGAAVTFPAGTKEAFCAVPAARVMKFQRTTTAAFSTTIPLITPGARYMPQQTVASVLAFTVGPNPVQGALVYLRLVADGTNAPTFTGFKEWGGSSGYDNRAGIVNEVQFFYDGYDYWFSVSQAVGAVAIDTVAPTVSTASVANSTPTIVNLIMSEAMDPAYVPAASAFTVGGHTASAVSVSGSTMGVTVSAAFVNGEAASTLAYTQPGTNNARDLAGNLLANFTGKAITNNVAAVDTTAPLLTSPGGTQTGTTTATVSVTTNEATGTLYCLVSANTTELLATVKASPLTQAVSSTGAKSFNITGLTAATSYYSHFVHTDASNNDSLVANGSGFTTASSATAPATMASPTATGGDTIASVVLVAPSNGGSAITGYTVISSPAGMTDTNAGTTGLTHAMTGGTNGTAYTFTANATNSVGTSAASPASNSVTLAAAAASLRASTMSGVAETGTGTTPDPWTYTGTTANNFGSSAGHATFSAKFQSGVDGSLVVKVTATPTANGSEILLIVDPVITNDRDYGNSAYALVNHAAGYALFTSASQGATSGTVGAINDYIRVTRTGSTLVYAVSKDSGATYTTVSTSTGVSTGILYLHGAFAKAGGMVMISSTGLA